jgi:hypothetical protein
MEDGFVTFLDQKEKELIEILTKEYEKFVEPGTVQKHLTNIQEKASHLIPDKIKNNSTNYIKKASDWAIIQKVMEKAGQGFTVIQENTARLSLDKNKVLKTLNNESLNIKEFEGICKFRSYYIEKIVLNRRRLIDLPTAFVGGGATGFFGLWGVPFNLAYTFFMYYRSVQTIAVYYGYDVLDDPRELEFASTVTITCLSPNLENDVENLGSIIGKMMIASNVTSLTESLSKLTYQKMAEKGGAELLYVQIRALANAQAKKALEKAGEQGIEAGIFKNLLEQIGKRMSQETGKKAVPVIGAVIGSLLDTATMSNIIKGANLVYHKRFLFEKDIKIKSLNGNNNESLILDHEGNTNYNETYNNSTNEEEESS